MDKRGVPVHGHVDFARRSRALATGPARAGARRISATEQEQNIEQRKPSSLSRARDLACVDNLAARLIEMSR